MKIVQNTAWRGSKIKCHSCGHSIKVGTQYEVLFDGKTKDVLHPPCADRLLWIRNLERTNPDTVADLERYEAGSWLTDEDMVFGDE